MSSESQPNPFPKDPGSQENFTFIFYQDFQKNFTKEENTMQEKIELELKDYKDMEAGAREQSEAERS